MNNSKFNDYIDVIYQEELETNDTTDAPKWANFLYIRLECDEDGKLYMRLYDKRDEFDFPIVNFPYLNSNIPESSAYAVLVSQLIRFARLFSKHEDILRGSILVAKLLKQGYSSQKLHCSRDILHGNFRLLLRNYMVAIHTYVSHMLKGLFTNCDT